MAEALLNNVSEDRSHLRQPGAAKRRAVRSARTGSVALKRLVPGVLAALLALALAPPARCEVSITLSLDRSDATLADASSVRRRIRRPREDAGRRSRVSRLPRQAGRGVHQRRNRQRKYSAGTEFSYLLQPKKAGVFRIGPAELAVGGTTYRSNVATVTVGQPPRRPPAIAGPSSRRLARAREGVRGAAGVADAQALRSVNIADVSISVPETDGLVLSKIGEPREYQGQHQGEPSDHRDAVSRDPQEAGNYALAPMRMDLVVFARQAGAAADLRRPLLRPGRSGRPLTLTSQALALQALPLPQQGGRRTTPDWWAASRSNRGSSRGNSVPESP